MDMKIAQITIAQQDFASVGVSLLLSTLVCDDVGVVTLAGDLKSFTLASGRDYFIVATLNGKYVSSSGNQQVCFGFYNNGTGSFITNQSGSRVILSHREFRGHGSSTVEMMALETASALTLSVRPVSMSGGYFRTYYPEDVAPASHITIMYKDIY